MIEFGIGKEEIKMIYGVSERSVSVLFKNADTQPNHRDSAFISGDEWNPDVVMEFYNTDSIQMLIDTLIKVKDQLNSLRN